MATDGEQSRGATVLHGLFPVVRTKGEFVLAALRLIVLLIVALTALVLVAKFIAEPGSTIKVLGIIELQTRKGEAEPPPPDPTPYVLPDSQAIEANQTLPILDGSVTVVNMGRTRFAKLIGPGIDKVAARTQDGLPLSLYREADTEQQVLFDAAWAYIEIEHRSRSYGISRP